MADEDPVERLVRLGGARLSASEDRTERVRTRVHAEWTRTTRARVRRTRFAAAAATLALAGMVLLVVQLSTGRGARPAAPSAVVATLASATGTLVLESQPFANQPVEVPVGGVVHASRVIRTSAGVFAALTLTGGTAVRVDEGTRLRIESPRDVVLIAGRIYVETASSGGSAESIQVHTSFGDVRDVGTRFEVRVADGQLRVRVRDGEVVVSAGTDSARAGRGMEIAAGANGLETRAVALFGSDWAWLSKTMPRFALAGRTLAEFLDWVSREAGYTVSVEGTSAAAASRTVLHGSIDGLTPDEALEVVLPAAGLEHRIDEGHVIVDAR